MARKQRKEIGALTFKQNKKLTRQKMDIDLAKHFLKYIFTSGLIQGVAYGTSEINLSDGHQQVHFFNIF